MIITKNSPNVQCVCFDDYRYHGDIITTGYLRIDLPALTVRGKVKASCGINTLGSLTVDGDIITEDVLNAKGGICCGGNIHAGAISSGGNVTAEGEITASFDIDVTGVLIAKKRIVTAGNIHCGGKIHSGNSVTAGQGIRSDGDIVAGGHILSGAGIAAGRRIQAGSYVSAELRIFAGTSTLDAGEQADNRIICSALRKGTIEHGNLIILE